MKVDLGQCAVCGAKNSKYVEKCYKCGAALPWAPDYVAPKNAPQPVAPDNAKTVVVTPSDIKPIDATPASTVVTEAKSGVSARVQSKVAVPAWALFAGGLGLLVLGMALWALLNRKPAPQTVAVAPTPAQTAPALAPIAPVASAMPDAVTTPDAADTPAQQPTLAPNAPAVAATGPPISQPTVAATEAPTTGVAVAPEIGPSFDELYANLTTGTPQQQALYWESVKGRKINWRGEFVSLGNAAAGPLVVSCKAAKGALKVTVALDEATPQTLPQWTPRQSVPFAGILQSRSAGAVTIKEGRVG